MAAATVGVKVCRSGEGEGQGHQKGVSAAQKDLFIKALRLNCSILLKAKPTLSPEVQESLDLIDVNMSIKEMLFASRHLLAEIPLTKIWLMVRYPSLATYAQHLLEGVDSAVSAEEIAVKLLEAAESTKEMGEVLYMLLNMSNKADSPEYRKLETMLSDGLNPSKDKKVFVSYNQREWEEMQEWRKKSKPLAESSNTRLYRTFLQAAESADWGVFYSCMKEGAKITECSELSGQSPLHAALATGRFSLSALAYVLQFDKDLANFRDSNGTPVLHVAALHDKESLGNVKFLIEHGADVNAEDANRYTVLQHLVKELSDLREKYQTLIEACHQNAKSGKVDRLINALMTLITESVKHGQRTELRKGPDGWTVLHVLSAMGAHQHILTCVEHGADPKELRQDLTIIDTVDTQTHLTAVQKMTTLKVLFRDLKLADFHAQVINRRAVKSPCGEFDNTYRCPLTYMVGCREQVNFDVAMTLLRMKAIGREELSQAWKQRR